MSSLSSDFEAEDPFKGSFFEESKDEEVTPKSSDNSTAKSDVEWPLKNRCSLARVMPTYKRRIFSWYWDSREDWMTLDISGCLGRPTDVPT